MEWQDYDDVTTTLRASLPGRVVGVLGSSSLQHPQSEATCREIGHVLGDLDGVALVTGGVGGVGEAVARSAFARRAERGEPANIFHLLPPQYRPWDYGENIVVGETFVDRREVLARIADVYLCIEGGPGTEYETVVAMKRGAPVVPLGRSGGWAGRLYARLERPAFAEEGQWRQLGTEVAELQEVAEAVCGIALAALR